MTGTAHDALAWCRPTIPTCASGFETPGCEDADRRLALEALGSALRAIAGEAEALMAATLRVDRAEMAGSVARLATLVDDRALDLPLINHVYRELRAAVIELQPAWRPEPTIRPLSPSKKPAVETAATGLREELPARLSDPSVASSRLLATAPPRPSVQPNRPGR